MTDEYTFKGSVVVVAPVTKKLMTKSSRLIANASITPERMPGRIRGSVTVKNARTGDAPRSREASISDGSMPASLPLTMMNTYGVQNVTCASTSVSIPNRNPANVNTARNAMPRMISGTIIGRSASVSIAPCSLNLRADIPTAPSVPITIEMPQLIPARIRLFFSAASRPFVSFSSPL